MVQLVLLIQMMEEQVSIVLVKVDLVVLMVIMVLVVQLLEILVEEDVLDYSLVMVT